MKTLSMKSLDDLDSILLVAREEYEKHGDRQVVIKKLTESISEAQRGLYWWWLKYIGAEHGNSKDEQHMIFKEQFLLRIYLNDVENHHEFADLVKNMQIIKHKAPEQYPTIRAFVIRETHIADATVENMKDYLKEIEAHARDYQIRLPAPDRDGLI